MTLDAKFMAMALQEAHLAYDKGEIPVGAVIVEDGAVIARAHNLRQTQKDPLAHAELLALRGAAQYKGDWRFFNCTLYVTLEPCAMCAGALLMARIGRIVFGAYDEKQGCCGSVYLLPMDKALRGTSEVYAGVMEKECQTLLTDFFKALRTGAEHRESLHKDWF